MSYTSVSFSSFGIDFGFSFSFFPFADCSAVVAVGRSDGCRSGRMVGPWVWRLRRLLRRRPVGWLWRLRRMGRIWSIRPSFLLLMEFFVAPRTEMRVIFPLRVFWFYGLLFFERTYRICRNNSPGSLIFQTSKLRGPLLRPPPKLSCIPPLKNHPSKPHRFHVLPPLKNHPSRSIGFMYSPLWKITLGESLIRGGGASISANTVILCCSIMWDEGILRARLMRKYLDSKYSSCGSTADLTWSE